MTQSAKTSPAQAEAADERTALAAVSGPRMALACLFQWMIPGAGYAVLGRFGRALIAFLGVALMVAWGLMLDGQLGRPQQNQFLSYTSTFASLGIGVAYFVVTGLDGLNRGLGDKTSVTNEFGTTFILAAGLIGFLLVLDVYDIAVGRKG